MTLDDKRATKTTWQIYGISKNNVRSIFFITLITNYLLKILLAVIYEEQQKRNNFREHLFCFLVMINTALSAIYNYTLVTTKRA